MMNAEVYSKPNCPFCDRAKALLNRRGISYTEISAVLERDALIERVVESCGSAPRTVPQIYLDSAYIGGYDALVAHFETTD